MDCNYDDAVDSELSNDDAVISRLNGGNDDAVDHGLVADVNSGLDCNKDDAVDMN